MPTHYIKILTLGVMGVLSIYFYYIFYPFHGETKTFFLAYLITLACIYGAYKFIQYAFPVEKRAFNALWLIGFFLFHLFILSIFFFAMSGQSLGLGLILFFKISALLLGISLLWIVIYALGNTLVGFLRVYKKSEDKILHLLASLGGGFFVFMLGVFFLAAIGLYNIYAILGLIISFALVSYRSILYVFENIQTPLVEYRFQLGSKASFTEKYNLAYIIDEAHYLVITFLLSINFINVFRPYPIGWDDLGVYMNYPKLLAQAGELIPLGQMHTWQLYTGIGFLSGSQTIAFFMNSFSAIIAGLVVYFSLKVIMGEERKSYFNIPLLCVVILLMMPMSVFQLAKDMKLDYGLLAFSVIPVTLLYTYLVSEKKYSFRNTSLIFLIIGLLIGLSFSIKLTSLLLFLASVSVIFYKRLSLSGFLGFLLLFISVFSYGKLWAYMNVVLPGSTDFILNLSIISALGAVGFFIYSYLQLKDKKLGERIFLEIGVLGLGFILALLPWGIKHIEELPAGTPISIGGLLSGYTDAYVPNFEAIYTETELAEKKLLERSAMESDGTSSNEDFGRYFGYEQGINNYLKLPWNLTFQVNQKGEFTDITFIFLALLPALFLFLPYRREYFIYPLIGSIGLLLLYYIPSPASVLLTSVFSLISLPFGYIFILGFFLAPLFYLFYSLDRKEKISQIFLINYAFTTLYVFLWTISAFGIVWYGITMYFLFLVMISLCLSAYQKEDSQYTNGSIYRYMTLGIIWSYIIISVIPHGLTNITTAGYNEYKMGVQTEEAAIFVSHPDYFPVLFELNIDPTHHKSIYEKYKKRLEEALGKTEGAEKFIGAIAQSQDIYQLKSIMSQLTQYTIEPALDKKITDLLQSLYSEVIYVDSKIKNEKNIYRVGTFLKYFISENNKRIFEDSLLVLFNNYIYEKDSLNMTVQRFKSLELEYILLDLNAATIDTDPEQHLTQRYENMLKVATHPNIELIESDSVCLKLGLDNYKQNNDMETYLNIAGINYGNVEERNKKMNQCLDVIVETIVAGEVSAEKHPYLVGYLNALNKLEAKEIDMYEAKNTLAPYLGISYKALFKIN